jgi:long-chain acyl-CoA synthetase
MQRSEPISTLNHLFFHHLDSFQRSRLLVWQRLHEMVVYSTERFAHSVFALRNFLRCCGLSESDRVAIFSENRPEWHIADFAILLAHRIVVPIYATLAPGQVQYLLQNSGCRAVIVSGPRQWAMLEPLLASLPRVEWIISMDECAIDTDRRHKPITLQRIVADAPAFDQAATETIRDEALSIDPQSIATIVYTSGTTARPKGVMLSHANIVFDLDGCIDRLDFRTVKRALSVLPLPHVFERLLCYGYFRMGVPISYGDPHELRDLLKLHHPEVMGCVPRVLEKIREAVEAQVERMPAWKQTAARWLFRVALERARRKAQGQGADLSSLLSSLPCWLLAMRIRGQLGGLRYFICGGAWLDPALELFFRSIGFVTLQGYGMTETSPVITFSRLGHEKLGAVGQPLSGVELRISEEGEIMTRGPHTMRGYYNDTEATARAFRDGWLLTGDLGSVDSEGFLHINGRRKELLVLSNGKKVGCAPLEHALERSRLIQNAFLVGEGRKFATVLIVPHLKNLAQLAHDSSIPFENDGELLRAAPVWSLVRQEIDAMQAEFSNFERAKRFCFLDEEALLDPELITPTQKMRRDVLERKFADWIARMYLQEDPLVIPYPGSMAETLRAHG